MSLEQPSLLEWEPPRARKSDPPTSHMAARRAELGASEGRMTVLKLLIERGPLTDFQLAEASGKIQTSIGVRRHECQFAGLVERALDGHGEDVRRPSPSGSPSLVWSITADGRAFYAERCK